MADQGDSAKKDNPRYDGLTGGSAGSYYLARRYFGLSPKKWDRLPWWESVLLIEGLKDQGILKGGNATTGSSNSGVGGQPVDLTDGSPIPRGFNTRRAG